MTLLDPTPTTPIGVDRLDAAHAELRELEGRTVAFFALDGRHADGSGAVEAEVVERALELAERIGCPVVGMVRSVAVGPTSDGGLDALAAWGRVAARTVRLSGVVPLLLAVTGPVHGSLAPILGLADHVVLTRDATAYVNGPGPVGAVTGLQVQPEEIGGAEVHATRSGLASLIAEDEDDALAALADILDHLPDNHLLDAPVRQIGDPADRPSPVGGIVPPEPSRAYDVRDVLAGIVDEGSLLEVHAGRAPNIVTAYARLDGRSVAIVANQPAVRAGTLDIDASTKAARHVRGADALGLPLLTFVDTPGYEPGRDLERRGMIRHGAKLVAAYAGATVPRLGVILRKAYGGAYIVMDSRTMGNDLILAWPTAEIAVMGAPGAVAILHRRDIDGAEDPESRRSELEDEYRVRFLSPRIAAERGLVDRVIDPADTRRILAAALRRLSTKRVVLPERRHANEPL